MPYAFQIIKHIMQPYLDDLSAHSLRREDHPMHLRAILIIYCYYNICLNPYKCVFCVQSGKFLGFLISKKAFVSIH